MNSIKKILKLLYILFYLLTSIIFIQEIIKQKIYILYIYL